MVPLSSLVSFEESAVAPNLPRQDQRRSVPIGAGLGDGVDLSQAMDGFRCSPPRILPPGMGISFTGEAKELNSASGGVARTFAFALLIVAACPRRAVRELHQRRHPDRHGAVRPGRGVFAILLTGGSLNIYSQIGLVMLVGLMSKNGILIVEFANQLRDPASRSGNRSATRRSSASVRWS
jgi:hydrophobic/amphiphilic exporter-1 (mainly G- bacteria), HAE1 family